MQPYIAVTFVQRLKDPGLESAVHRWVARLESMVRDVVRVNAIIDAGGRRTTVSLTVSSSTDEARVHDISHADPYVAVSNAFRAARQELLARQSVRGPQSLLTSVGPAL